MKTKLMMAMTLMMAALYVSACGRGAQPGNASTTQAAHTTGYQCYWDNGNGDFGGSSIRSSLAYANAEACNRCREFPGSISCQVDSCIYWQDWDNAQYQYVLPGNAGCFNLQ